MKQFSLHLKSLIITGPLMLMPYLMGQAFANGSGTSDPFHARSEQPNTVVFEENRGQLKDQFRKTRPDVRYFGRTQGMNFYVRNTGVSYQLSSVESWKSEDVRHGFGPGDEAHLVPDQITSYRVDMNWLGANSGHSIQTGNQMDGHTNYYNVPEGVEPAIGVRQFESITLKRVYDGIDLHCYTTDGHLETDWLVSPGADFRQIRMEIKGADLSVDDDGRLVMSTPFGEIREGALKVYQGDERVEAKWVIAPLNGGEKGGVVSFDIPSHDPEKSLRIDPMVVVRQWGTYYGGPDTDRINASTVDDNGNVIIAGVTASTSDITSGGHQNTYGAGAYDAFLVKFDGTGVRQWATYYGGAADDWGNGCAVDGNGNVFLSGSTPSTSGIASDGHQNTFGGGDYDAFLVKFDADGVRQWGTYYGGTGYDAGQGCAADDAGNVYLTGTSNTTSGLASGGYQNTYGGGSYDGFLVKFDADGSRVWATYYGGNALDEGKRISIDGNGNVILAGDTYSPAGISSTGHQDAIGGNRDGFLVKFDSDGTRLWGTYYGGESADYALSCATDANGNVFLVGMADSISVLTMNGHQTEHGGGAFDGFLLKFDGDGELLWSTYYGGEGADHLRGCFADGNGNVHVCGDTRSDDGIAMNGQQNTRTEARDAFLAKFDSTGVRLWGTYYGGAGDDQGFSCASDVSGFIYMSGFTVSTSGIAIDGHQTALGGGQDAFLVKFFGDCVPMTGDFTQTDAQVPCHGDETATIIVNAEGGMAPYEFSADGGLTFQSSELFTGLGVGTYDLFIRDAQGCVSAQMTADVTQPSQVDFSASNTDNICPDGTAAIISVNASGGAGDYQYSVDNGLTFQPQSIITGLASGTHQVVVRDALGCVSEPQEVTITEPTAFNVNFTVQEPLCHGLSTGIIVVVANGGTGSLQYSLNSAAYQPSTLFTGLASNNYDIIVKDAANCESQHTVTVGQPEQITFNAMVGDVECRNGTNGSIDLTVSGGTPDYQYSWMPQVSTSASASGLQADSYTITVTDANNCSQTTSVTVTEPDPIEVPVCLVTVDSTSTFNIVVWEKPLSAEIDSFFVYREVTQGSYQLIGSLPYDAEGRFEDNEANPNVTSYRYRISALDTCGEESPLSPFHTTIHLQQLGNGNLLWSHYGIEGQQNPVQFYRVYRDNLSSGDFQPISTTVPGGNNSYTDINFSMFPNASYVVDVAWDLSCDPNRVLTTTRSNRYIGQLPVGLPTSRTLEFHVYPNPANTEFRIIATDYSDMRVEVLDISGRSLIIIRNYNGQAVDISALSQGVYPVRVSTPSGAHTVRLLRN